MQVPLGAGTSNEVWLLEGSDPALGRFVVRLPRLDGNLTLPTMTLWQQLSAEHNSLHANLSLGQKDRGGVPVVGMLFVRRQRGWDGRAAWQILREGAKEPGLDLGAALESGDLNVALVYRRCIDLKELLALLLALVSQRHGVQHGSPPNCSGGQRVRRCWHLPCAGEDRTTLATFSACELTHGPPHLPCSCPAAWRLAAAGTAVAGWARAGSATGPHDRRGAALRHQASQLCRSTAGHPRAAVR